MIRLKVRFIGTVGSTGVVIHANFRENLRRGLSNKFLQVDPNIPITPSPSLDEIFSQTMRRIKVRFIVTKGATLGVIYAMFQDNLPRGL